jgi:hypothetical protein
MPFRPNISITSLRNTPHMQAAETAPEEVSA